MPMDTVRAATPWRSFALRLIAWSLALFGLLRLPWVGAHILLPATQLQAAAGSALLGPSSLPIEVTLACSGADALALGLAAIVAYPARWRRRAAGAACVAAVILALNTIRIGTLGRAAASPRWFDALHVYVWPAVLTMAIAGFVFSWMRAADRRRSWNGVRSSRPITLARGERVEPRAGRSFWPPLSETRILRQAQDERESTGSGPADGPARQTCHSNATGFAGHADTPYALLTRRFALLAATFLVFFTLASPLYLESARVLAVAGMVARAAAFLLRLLGMDASATARVLATPGGAYLVTQECISTPLIPVYLAAVVVYSRSWRAGALWSAAGVPLFVGLGIARMLVVAVPAGLGPSPVFLIHAFSQLLVAAGMVCGLALWRYGARARALVSAAAAMALAIAFVRLLGAPYTHAILWFRTAATDAADPQGALMFLPAFQFGLFLALWVAAFVPSGWTRFLCGASLLAAIQIAVAGGVQLLAAHAGVSPMVRDVRAWALLGPALIIAAVVNLAPSRR